MRRSSPAALRRALELQSRVLFFAPRGTVKTWGSFGAVPCLEIQAPSSKADRVLLYIHGGAFVFGSPNTHAAMAATLAQKIGARAVLPQYSLAPEAAFPASPDDVRSVWDALCRGCISAQNIVVGGDSAGGALALGLVASLLSEGAPTPGAVFGLSPLTDLTFSGESLQTNAEADVVLPAERAAELGNLFLQGNDSKSPVVSPLHGAFQGAPPAWITVGDTEILLDDGREMAARLRAQNVDTTLVVAHDLPHVWPIFHNILPEGRQTLSALAAWIRQQQNWEAES
ncbi:MAG: alpha/beta hydrolase [Sulfitobacter sp.]